MSKKRPNGQFGSAAVTEAARRQLMQPVACWEKVWFTPEGSKVKVRKWAQTKNQPQWSDDEGDNINQPLAPLPDAEVMDLDEEDEGGDQEADLVEPIPVVGANAETPALPADQEVPPVVQTPSAGEADLTLDTLDTNSVHIDMPLEVALDDSVGVLDPGLDLALVPEADFTSDLVVDVGLGDLTTSVGMDMLPPDGTAFEAVHDLSQVEADDALLGGQVMDASNDPFVGIP